MKIKLSTGIFVHGQNSSFFGKIRRQKLSVLEHFPLRYLQKDQARVQDRHLFSQLSQPLVRFVIQYQYIKLEVNQLKLNGNMKISMLEKITVTLYCFSSRLPCRIFSVLHLWFSSLLPKLKLCIAHVFYLQLSCWSQLLKNMYSFPSSLLCFQLLFPLFWLFTLPWKLRQKYLALHQQQVSF